MNFAPHGRLGTSGINLVCLSCFFLSFLGLLAVHRFDLVVTTSVPVIVGWVLAICVLFDYPWFFVSWSGEE